MVTFTEEVSTLDIAQDLEEVILRALGDLGIEGAGRTPGLTGVWVGDFKIAAIGVRQNTRFW